VLDNDAVPRDVTESRAHRGAIDHLRDVAVVMGRAGADRKTMS
jgi:hypothetical protein